MNKRALKLATTIVILLSLDVQASTYLCLFGPDSQGGYAEEVVNENVAENCGDFCMCNEVQPKCLFGPDGTGDFVIEKVSVEFSAQCDRSFCTCTDHEDY